MTVEVNPHFSPRQSEFGGIAITPLIDENFFIARVMLYEDQAICIFPKFFTIGCGFAKEDDWNTNLPLSCDAEEIYTHIEHNKLYDAISREQCIEAIRLLQGWYKSEEAKAWNPTTSITGDLVE
jgi:hypothetical protein